MNSHLFLYSFLTALAIMVFGFVITKFLVNKKKRFDDVLWYGNPDREDTLTIINEDEVIINPRSKN